MWVAMSAAEREEFLAGVHVGVLSAAIGTAGQTVAVPVWYSYQPGGLVTVLTGRRSRKAAAIRAAGRFGLDNVAPGDYKVFAWDEVSDGDWNDPEFVRPSETRGSPVRISDGATESVSVTVIGP